MGRALGGRRSLGNWSGRGLGRSRGRRDGARVDVGEWHQHGLRRRGGRGRSARSYRGDGGWRGGQVGPVRRVAVVQGGVTEQTIATKAYRTTVTMSEDGSTPFTMVIDDVVYPAPTAATADAYIFYIGFDPQALTPEPKAAAKRKKK